jgi:hypothetical protein
MQAMRVCAASQPNSPAMNSLVSWPGKRHAGARVQLARLGQIEPEKERQLSA